MNYEERLQDLLDELDLFQDWTERYEYIISLGKKLPRLDEAYKTEDSLIKGCQSRVWLHTEPDNGVLKLYADSDSLITKGLIAVFIRLLSGLPPEEILKADMSKLDKTGLKDHLAPTRANALNSMAAQIKQAAIKWRNTIDFFQNNDSRPFPASSPALRILRRKPLMQQLFPGHHHPQHSFRSQPARERRLRRPGPRHALPEQAQARARCGG